MTYQEALRYLETVSPTFCKPGLERVKALCAALGHPEKNLPVIHVTGTNGKGSVCALLSSVLTVAGYRVGLFTSPFVKRRNESIRLCGKEISDEALAALVSRAAPIVAQMDEKPTDFEISTAIALLYFKEQAPDVVIVETGMGARLDATNLFSSVLLSIVTNVSLEHTAFLGDTVEAIAREKAGVIKEGCPILYGGEDTRVQGVLLEIAEERKAPFYTVDPPALTVSRADLFGFVLSYRERKDLSLALSGSYQPKNAATALDALDILRPSLPRITEDAVREGLAAARWPARFEILSRAPLVLFDGGHNPDGIRQATDSVRRYFGDEKICLLSGILKDKDLSAIGTELASVSHRAFAVAPPSPRALPAADYAAALNGLGLSTTPYESVADALREALSYARKQDIPLLVLGSLYLYDTVTELLPSLLTQENM